MSKLRIDLNKYKPRKEQVKALEFIDMVEKKKPDNKFYLFDLPPGVGKSHLAIMTANYYLKKYGMSSRVDIITAGKILQDQYASEYESVDNLKGSDNYACDTYNCTCDAGRKLNRLNKEDGGCEDCPFVKAREDYKNGIISLTNYHLYLNYVIYGYEAEGAEFSNPVYARKSRVLIVDEAHEFDSVISDFISLKITESGLKKLELIKENSMKAKFAGIQNIDQYVKFLNELLTECFETLKRRGVQLATANTSVELIKAHNNFKFILGGDGPAEMDEIEVIDRLNNMVSKISTFLADYKSKPENWILEKTYNEKTKTYDLSLEPLWSRDYLDKYVWSRYDKIFLISGTILNKGVFCDMNGIDASKAAYLQMSSPFPLDNRKIQYVPVGKMTMAKKEETFRKMQPIINRIINKYNNDKGIIHSNSFELSTWIRESNFGERMKFHGSEDRELVLRLFMEGKNTDILVSPSVTTGVSFDDDKARFQIIPKVPYPSLGSVKNKMRQQQSQLWYDYMTVAKIIQTYGRVCRSNNDYGVTIILDSSFGDLMKNCSHLMPMWFQKAIKKYDLK